MELDMDGYKDSQKHRKWHRRRREKQRPLSAKLELEDGRGVGAISHDLAAELYGRHADEAGEADSEVLYVALTGWQSPRSPLEIDCNWTIVPVRVSLDLLQPSSLRIPASFALQTLTRSLRRIGTGRSAQFEVLVIDVEPLPLKTVLVRIDAKTLDKHEEVQRRFGGGFQPKTVHGTTRRGEPTDSKLDSKLDSIMEKTSLEVRLRNAVRSSMATASIIRLGDLIHLPLPAHPITHTPFPPAQVILCEPVNQGLMAGTTKIVIDINNKGKGKHLLSQGEEALCVSEDDTSAEQFYSAAENDEDVRRPPPEHRDSMTSQTSNSDASDFDEASSEASSDDMVSLSTPGLARASGILSSMTGATPRANGPRKSGISTPGSVYSSFTATSARHRNLATGRSFEAKPLINRVPDNLLLPAPGDDEDDESRVFIDIKMLVRLGCFSGDWIRVSPSISKTVPSFSALTDETGNRFALAKVYGIKDLSPKGFLQYSKSKAAGTSFHSAPSARISPPVYMSPLLFANLGAPSIVSLSEASDPRREQTRKSKVSSSFPPVAKEITLLRIPTPLTSQRAFQPGLFAALKHYFEGRRRILRIADILAVRIDAGISRILSENGELDSDTDLLLVSRAEELASPDITIAWFKIGSVTKGAGDIEMDGEVWGDVVSTEASITRIKVTGSSPGSVPSTIDNPWEYYLGLKRFSNTSVTRIYSTEALAPSFVSATRRRLRELLAVATSSRSQRYNMKPVVVLLHSTRRYTGKTHTAMAACADLGLHAISIDAYEITAESGTGGNDVKSEAYLEARIDRALESSARYTVPIITHVEILTAERMISAISNVVGRLQAIIMTTTEIGKIPDGIRSLVTHEMEISAPGEVEREGILRDIFNHRAITLSHDVDVGVFALRTAALVAGDLVDVVDRALVARQTRLETLLEQSNNATRSPTNGTKHLMKGIQHVDDGTSRLPRDILVSGGAGIRGLSASDLSQAVDAARRNFADSIGAPKIPSVSWEDVGGLQHVQAAVAETIQLPLERPELFSRGLKKRSGILLYGPPGTGKTLLAKAVATAYALNFFSVKGPELLNMYIGESEANVRRVFQRARDARPCVVFFDELDSVAPKRGNQGDSGGVMDRIVSQLLAELDGMSDGDGGGVFVIGATNRPDLLDQALLRPGRFDKMLYLGVADTHEQQLKILEALTRKFALHPALRLRDVADSLPFTYTGADLYALCSDAMLKAVMRKARLVEAKVKELGGEVTTAWFFDHRATEVDVAVVVEEEDFAAARSELVGSVSAKELEHYRRVRATFEGPPSSLTQPRPRSPARDSPLTPPRPAFRRQSTSRTYSSTSTANRKGKAKQKEKSRPWDTEAVEEAGDDDDNSNGRFKKYGKENEDSDQREGRAGNVADGVSSGSDSNDDDDDEAYVTSLDYKSPKFKPKVKEAAEDAEGKVGEATILDFGQAEDDNELYE